MTNDELLLALYTDMQEMKSVMKEMKCDMQEMKQRVASLELTLENETNRNIKIIAEGHTDLSRKLDLALKENSEKEWLRIRVNILENEMRKVKERLDIA